MELCAAWLRANGVTDARCLGKLDDIMTGFTKFKDINPFRPECDTVYVARRCTTDCNVANAIYLHNDRGAFAYVKREVADQLAPALDANPARILLAVCPAPGSNRYYQPCTYFMFESAAAHTMDTAEDPVPMETQETPVTALPQRRMYF
jgi:hypothetical protein